MILKYLQYSNLCSSSLLCTSHEVSKTSQNESQIDFGRVSNSASVGKVFYHRFQDRSWFENDPPDRPPNRFQRRSNLGRLIIQRHLDARPLFRLILDLFGSDLGARWERFWIPEWYQILDFY